MQSYSSQHAVTLPLERKPHQVNNQQISFSADLCFLEELQSSSTNINYWRTELHTKIWQWQTMVRSTAALTALLYEVPDIKQSHLTENPCILQLQRLLSPLICYPGRYWCFGLSPPFSSLSSCYSPVVFQSKVQDLETMSEAQCCK